MNLRRHFLGVGVLAVLAAPFLFGTVWTSGRIIVPAGELVSEDLYAFGSSVDIEGTIAGDLFAVAGNVTISGTVQGDVVGLVGGPLRITGDVQGAVRVAAVEVEIDGSVGDDMAVLAVETHIAGDVGRDLLLIGGEASLTGSVGRDIRLQALRLGIDGSVGRDILVRVDSLAVGPAADVSGDLLYRASSDATVTPGALLHGQFTRRAVLAPVWAKAVTRLIEILSLFGLIVGGLAAMWLFRGTSAGAVAEVERRPWRAGLVGLIALVAIPLLMFPLFLTLVGIPIALLLLVCWIVALVLGPIPAVTRLGSFLLRGRGGAAGALVVGAVTWRASMWALPLIGGLLYLTALVVGLGAFMTAGWQLRRAH